MMIHGAHAGCGQQHLGCGILQCLEEFPVYCIDLPSLYGSQTTKCAEEALLTKFKEARRNAPSVVYWPHIDRWWESANESLRTSTSLLVQNIQDDTPVFVLATSDRPLKDQDDEIRDIFHSNDYAVGKPGAPMVKAFWSRLSRACTRLPKRKVAVRKMQKLKPAENQGPVASEAQKRRAAADDRLRTENEDFVCLRTFIRSVCTRLCKHFKNFLKPLDIENVIQNDLTLIDIRQNNNDRAYPTAESFLADIDLLVSNVKHSATPDLLKAREYINEACHLQDTALAMMCQVNREIARRCSQAAKKRKTSAPPAPTNQTEDPERLEISDGAKDTRAPDDSTAQAQPAGTGMASPRSKPQPMDVDSTDDQSNSTKEPEDQSSSSNAVHASSSKPETTKEAAETAASSSPSCTPSCTPSESEEAPSTRRRSGRANKGRRTLYGNPVVNFHLSKRSSVNIDRKKLTATIDLLCKKTQKYCVDELEQTYFRLMRDVCEFSDKYDRNDLVAKLHTTINALPRTRFVD